MGFLTIDLFFGQVSGFSSERKLRGMNFVES